MPLVRHALHHHLHKRFLPELTSAPAAERDLAQSLERLPINGGVQLHGVYGFGALFVVVVVLAYALRRHLRSIPSRLATVRPVFNFITVNLHSSVGYTALHHHHDETNEVDLESPVEELPPYAASKERNTRGLQIAVPPPRSSYAPSTPSSSAYTPSLLSDAGSSSAGSPLSTPTPSLSSLGPLVTPVSSPSQLQEQEQKQNRNIEPSKARVLDAAYNRTSYNIISPLLISPSSSPSPSPSPSPSLSPSPPPQYTITIHSSPRPASREGDGISEGPGTPDIVLSPVPWMPRESNPPPSPPCYLSVPPRKSRRRQTQPQSRQQSSSLSEREKEKPLPVILPVSKPVAEAKARHSNSVSPVPPAKETKKPNLPAGFRLHQPRRSQTLPNLSNQGQPRSPIPPPAPKPVLPLELEAVYPSSPSSEESDTSDTEGGWLWGGRPSSPMSQQVSTPEHKDAFQHSLIEKRPGLGISTPFGSEKTGMPEKPMIVSDEDEDELPLAKGLAWAIKRKSEMFTASPTAKVSQTASAERVPQLKSPVDKVFRARKQLFSRLSVLAAKAKETIEQQFDSSDEEDEEEAAFDGKENSFYLKEKEVRAVDTFVISDEDGDEE